MTISRISADDAEFAQGSDTGEVSHSHSITPGTDLLIVCVTGYYNAGADSASVDWHPDGGSRESMTEQVHSPSGGTIFGGYIFTLTNPTSGNGDVKVTTNLGSENYGVNVFAFSYDGVDKATPVVETNYIGSNQGNQTLSISFTDGESGDLIFGLSVNWNNTAGVGDYNGQTLLDPGSQLTNEDYSESFYKPWDSNNTLASQDSDYGSILGIVLGEADAPTSCVPCVLMNMGEL